MGTNVLRCAFIKRALYQCNNQRNIRTNLFLRSSQVDLRQLSVELASKCEKLPTPSAGREVLFDRSHLIRRKFIVDVTDKFFAIVGLFHVTAFVRPMSTVE